MGRLPAIFAGLVLATSLFPATSAYAFKDNLLNNLLSFHEQCIKQGGLPALFVRHPRHPFC